MLLLRFAAAKARIFFDSTKILVLFLLVLISSFHLVGKFFFRIFATLNMKRTIHHILLTSVVLLGLASDGRQVQAQKTSDDYVLVFSDEFNLPNGSQPDPTKWVRSQRNPSIWARWISPSKKVVYIKSGHLVCRSIPNKSELADTARMLTGAVESLGKFAFRYGKVEVRMKTNLLQGNFPAVWLKSVDQSSDSRYGEIDIVEMFGNKKQSHHTIHTHQTYTLKTRKPTEFIRKINVSRWHVYGMEWTPDYVLWTVDGKVVGRYQKSNLYEDIRDGQWTFDREYYLRLNQSVGNGSHLHFTPLLNKVYETHFDWIRVYQKP